MNRELDCLYDTRKPDEVFFQPARVPDGFTPAHKGSRETFYVDFVVIAPAHGAKDDLPDLSDPVVVRVVAGGLLHTVRGALGRKTYEPVAQGEVAIFPEGRRSSHPDGWVTLRAGDAFVLELLVPPKWWKNRDIRVEMWGRRGVKHV